ncbi:MAG: putative toxin-antitoxin system toxin component, PIN family [Nanoarchaeota archaeon]
MIVVLDTNILISAIFWRGNPYKILQQGLKKNYSLYLSSAILNELEEKLRIKFGLPQDKIEEHIQILTEYGNIIKPIVKLNAVKDDPGDDKILECAISCKADYIVSGDNHLLELKEFRGIKIITAIQFLDLIK